MSLNDGVRQFSNSLIAAVSDAVAELATAVMSGSGELASRVMSVIGGALSLKGELGLAPFLNWS